ncbi:MAG: HAD family phosphatase [Anaerolineae bacterium]|nr:HAD family phosphatase [Anaerolineae bacterium]
MTKGFIFDMDGVIIDTEPLYLEIVKNTLTELNIEITDEELHAYVGISSREMWQIIKTNHRLPQAVDWLVNQEKNRVAEGLQTVASLGPMAGIPELLKFLQQNNFKIGLASASSRQNVNLILQKLQLIDYFDATVSGEEVANGKPHPEIFLTCAAKLGVEPERCIVLEDSPHGIRGANSAGMVTIGLANPNSGRQDLTGANYVTTQIDDGLLGFIKRAR